MHYRHFFRLLTFLSAFMILGYSLAHISGVRYAFDDTHPTQRTKNAAEGIDIVYDLPYPGHINPQSPLWSIKVLRDRAAFKLSFSNQEKCHTALHLADKRLSAAYRLWNMNEMNESLVTLEKAVGYLKTSLIYAEAARKEGIMNADDYRQIVYSAQKHRQILETALSEAPDEARPTIHSIMTGPKEIAIKASASMLEMGVTPPSDPF